MKWKRGYALFPGSLTNSSLPVSSMLRFHPGFVGFTQGFFRGPALLFTLLTS